MIEEYRSNVLLHYLIFRNNDRNRNFSRSKKKKRILTFRPTIRVTIHFNPILEIRIRISPRIFTKFFYIVYHVPCSPNKRKEKTLSRFFNHSLLFLQIRGSSKRRRTSSNSRKHGSKHNETSFHLSSLKSVLKKKRKIITPLRSKDRNLEFRDNRESGLGESRVIKEASFHAGTISKRAGKNALGLSSSLPLSPRFQATEFRSIDRIGERNRRNGGIIKVEFRRNSSRGSREDSTGDDGSRFGAYLKGERGSAVGRQLPSTLKSRASGFRSDVRARLIAPFLFSNPYENRPTYRDR